MGNITDNNIVMLVCFVVALVFIIIGLIDTKSKKPVGIYSNIKSPNQEEITDVKAYNGACGKLIIAYGLLFLIVGIVSFYIKESHIAVLLTLSAFLGAIGMMIIYETFISPKYLKKNHKKNLY